MKIFSYTCPAFSFAKANWYFYSQNTFPKSPTANGDESGEKCSVRKTKHMFHIKKKILNISLSILSIQSPKEKEVRKLTAYLVNGRLRDLFSMHPGGSSYSPTQLENAPWLVWAHQDPPPCQHLLLPPLNIISTSQHRFLTALQAAVRNLIP